MADLFGGREKGPVALDTPWPVELKMQEILFSKCSYHWNPLKVFSVNSCYRCNSQGVYVYFYHTQGLYGYMYM
jgi:hypothetical protein